MSWLKLDDQFVEHDKVRCLSDRAFRLHVAGLCHAARRLSDGRLSTVDVDICRIVANRATGKHVEELVQARLWRKTGHGYEINDYLDYNPPADKVKADRRASADRQAKARARRFDEEGPNG